MDMKGTVLGDVITRGKREGVQCLFKGTLNGS